jgi:hypothetical protein
VTDLAVFGCSWTAGVGVLATDTFGARLADKLSATNFTNLGIQGSSNSRSVLQLLDYVKRTDIPVENSIAVFLITTPSRECILLDNLRQPIDETKSIFGVEDLASVKVVDLGVNQTDEISKNYIKHFASISTLNFNLHKNVLSMQAICRQYKIQDYYIVGWDNVDLNLPGIDTDKIYHKSCLQLFRYELPIYLMKKAPNQYLRTCGHPNELGHELIAQTLHSWIIKQRNVQS